MSDAIRFAKAAGLRPIRLHCFRHTQASFLDNCMPAAVAAKRLGMSTHIYYKTCVHPDDDGERVGLAALN